MDDHYSNWEWRNEEKESARTAMRNALAQDSVVEIFVLVKLDVREKLVVVEVREK